MNGNHMAEDQPLPGVNVGAKAIGVYGVCRHDWQGCWDDEAGCNSSSWHQDSHPYLTWATGSEMVVSSTSMELQETERIPLHVKIVVVEDNVINNGIFDEGEGNTNIEFFAGINIKRATKTIMTDNVAVGSPSDEDYIWSNNEAHGNQHGVHVTNMTQSRVSSW